MVRKGDYKYKISRDELYKLYITEEKSTIKIAELYGCRDEIIRRRMIKYGINRRKHKDISPSKETREKVRKKALERWQNPEFRDKQIKIIKTTSLPVLQSKKSRKKAVATRKKNYKEGKIVHPFLGKSLSEEHKNKISNARKGMKLSEETKEKLSKAHKNLYKNKENHPLYGKHLSEEHRRKISEANKGKKQTSEWKTKRLKASLKTQRARPIPIEQKFIEIIQKNELPFKYVGNGKFWIGGINPDFIHDNGKKIVVEVFGDYWHSPILNPKLKWNRTYQGRKSILEEHGWILIVFWEYELKSENVEQLVLNRISGIM